jgi:hypothetical protein
MYICLYIDELSHKNVRVHNMHNNENNNTDTWGSNCRVPSACNPPPPPPLRSEHDVPQQQHTARFANALDTLASPAPEPWLWAALSPRSHDTAQWSSLSNNLPATHSADRRLTSAATDTTFAARAFAEQLTTVYTAQARLLPAEKLDKSDRINAMGSMAP